MSPTRVRSSFVERGGAHSRSCVGGFAYTGVGPHAHRSIARFNRTLQTRWAHHRPCIADTDRAETFAVRTTLWPRRRSVFLLLWAGSCVEEVREGSFGFPAGLSADPAMSVVVVLGAFGGAGIAGDPTGHKKLLDQLIVGFSLTQEGICGDPAQLRTILIPADTRDERRGLVLAQACISATDACLSTTDQRGDGRNHGVVVRRRATGSRVAAHHLLATAHSVPFTDPRLDLGRVLPRTPVDGG